MSSKLQKFCALLAFVVSAAYAYAPARPYVAAVAGVLGALSLIGTSLAVLPGRAGSFFAALGKDVDAMRAAVVTPPSDGAKPGGPSVVARAASGLMLLLLVGCAGALPVVAQIVVDAGCVASHYDELAAAEQAGRGAFLLAVERTARVCGIEQQLVVTLFGSAKAQRTGAPACSASASMSPVNP